MSDASREPQSEPGAQGLSTEAERASQFTDRERLKWLSQNELICFGNHTIHKVGCIEQRGRALMRLENKNFTGFHWVVVSWREAIDAAMLAAGIKPASVDTVTMEEINEAYSKAFSIEFMRSDVHQGRSAGLRAVLALVKPGVKVVG